MIPEAKADLFPPRDLQVKQKAQLFQICQSFLRCLDAGSPFSLHFVGPGDFQRDRRLRRSLGDALEVGHNPRPVPPMLQVEPEEGIVVIHIAIQDPVIHPAGAHGAARHAEAVLHAEAHIAGQIRGKGSIPDIIKAISLAAVGKDGNGPLRAEKPGGEKDRVRAAGDIDGAVGILFRNTAQPAQHRFAVIDIGADEGELRLHSPMAEILLQLPMDTFVSGHILRAYIDHPPGAENLHSKHIFQRPFIIEFDQGAHGAATFLSFCFHFSTGCISAQVFSRNSAFCQVRSRGNALLIYSGACRALRRPSSTRSLLPPSVPKPEDRIE